MHQCSMLIWLAVVVAFSLILIVDGKPTKTTETNADRFRRGLGPAKPRNLFDASRSSNAHAPRSSGGMSITGTLLMTSNADGSSSYYDCGVDSQGSCMFQERGAPYSYPAGSSGPFSLTQTGTANFLQISNPGEAASPETSTDTEFDYDASLYVSDEPDTEGRQVFSIDDSNMITAAYDYFDGTSEETVPVFFFVQSNYIVVQEYRIFATNETSQFPPSQYTQVYMVFVPSSK